MAIKVNGCTVVDDIRNITAGVSTVTTGCVTGTMTGATVCATTGCVTGTFTGSTVCGGTVCATTGFSGDGSSLTNLTAANIPGLPALVPSGSVVCTTTFNSPGTFSKNPADKLYVIQVVGGGAGSGAGGPTGTPGPARGGGGGGGGGGVYYTIASPQVPPSVPVVVGAAGAAAPSRSVAATNGGNSCFGSVTSTGGVAGCNVYSIVCFYPPGTFSYSPRDGASGANGCLVGSTPGTSVYGDSGPVSFYSGGKGAAGYSPGSNQTSVFAGNGGDVNAHGCPDGGGGGGGSPTVPYGFNGSAGIVIVYAVRG